ncbi:hypothetical protein KKC61_03945 [Patescibacteria group bacterium]|nr:hypothetical protein [Patescibacteria group bacterium]
MNLEIANLLRNIAAAYQILDENRFRIMAYERAGDSIEHATREMKDIWEDEKLSEVPGVGKTLAQHLDELFRTGRVKHFESVMKRVPEAVFPLLGVPGMGPKKAYKLVKALHLNRKDSAIDDLEKAAREHTIAPIEGFGEKSEHAILEGISAYRRGQIKGQRMSLPEADRIAREVIAHMKKNPDAEKIDTLGSLRRQVATIGDIDIAVATTNAQGVIEHFLRFPHKKIIEQGPSGASVILTNGRQVDVRVQEPRAYGAMLQYFTGSKHHNIALREYALGRGKSLSEHGVKDVKTGVVEQFRTEQEFYEELGLQYIAPELREDRGEIEAGLRKGLPKLVGFADIKGDLHVHTSYDLHPSHDLGVNTLEECLDKAAALGYEYIGISDHNPSVSNQSKEKIIDIMKRRKEYYEQKYYSWKERVKKRVHLFIMCEADVLTDGTIALPEKAFDFVDAVIASIHSAFRQERKTMTKRVLSGLGSHPKVCVFGHPTGRLLPTREGIELDWEEIFAFCKNRKIALEINAYPSRLDLPDTLVYDAVKAGLPCIINTDAHSVRQMDLLPYGVSVARRGWCTKRDIANTMEYNKFKDWLLRH